MKYTNGTVFHIIHPWEGKPPQLTPIPHSEDEFIQCPGCGEDMQEYPNGELWCKCGTGLRLQEKET